MKFDVSETEFIRLAEKRPSIIQLKAKVKADCTPLELYAALDKKCAYLLESVEKEKKHARFSFVGTEPDAVVTIKDRIVSLHHPQRTNLVDFIESSLLRVCDLDNGGKLKPGYDTMDAIRAAFCANGVKFIGQGFEFGQIPNGVFLLTSDIQGSEVIPTKGLVGSFNH